jgi:lysozyme family protein
MRTELDHKMGQWILDHEARRDKKTGKLKVFPLKPADGGGKYEVAGINERFHPVMAAQLKKLIEAGKTTQAETEARNYILSYTDVAESWCPTHPGIEAFLRDTCFNRGPGGAAKVLQMALKVTVDGRVGPITKGAILASNPVQLIKAMRKAREAYERKIAPPVGARAEFWAGLVNRWNAAEQFALSLS